MVDAQVCMLHDTSGSFALSFIYMSMFCNFDPCVCIYEYQISGHTHNNLCLLRPRTLGALRAVCVTRGVRSKHIVDLPFILICVFFSVFFLLRSLFCTGVYLILCPMSSFAPRVLIMHHYNYIYCPRTMYRACSSPTRI